MEWVRREAPKTLWSLTALFFQPPLPWPRKATQSHTLEQVQDGETCSQAGRRGGCY